MCVLNRWRKVQSKIKLLTLIFMYIGWCQNLNFFQAWCKWRWTAQTMLCNKMLFFFILAFLILDCPCGWGECQLNSPCLHCTKFQVEGLLDASEMSTSMTVCLISAVTWANPTPRVGVVRWMTSAMRLVGCVAEGSVCQDGRTTPVSVHLRERERTVKKVLTTALMCSCINISTRVMLTSPNFPESGSSNFYAHAYRWYIL